MKVKMIKKYLISVLLLFVIANLAHAELRVEITQGTDAARPIAVVPFARTGLSAPLPADVSAIVAADLQRSGMFAPIEPDKLIAQPQNVEAVNYKLWRMANVDHIVIGQVNMISAQQFELEFRLLDVFKGQQILGFKYRETDKNLRMAAHKISDLIYERITGQRGAFNTQVAYVTVERQIGAQPKYKLQVADTDGYNSQTVLTSAQPIMSPSWSPDGSRLAYVSFEHRRSEIFIQNLQTGQRDVVSKSEGINGAPVWSPDGRQLALTLTSGDNPDIYVLDITSKKLQQVTRHWSIDTEPSWMPDGREIVFTSSRSGKPQLYRVNVNQGDRPQRITFDGDYNANARISPDGKSLAFVQGSGNVFKIATLDLQTGFVQPVTDGALDESPSFAPNGSMILYATQADRRGVLAAVSTDGRFKQRLVLSEGDVREPTWGPYKK
ncbi:MAG TPA: Tol-Pal system beta propeller repeat protein TolB [Gammaproteobacteria bacterium]|nr:Tol-Pal system beta propeller repeat protein TolB [Gammaproteobacteria bacterium]